MENEIKKFENENEKEIAKKKADLEKKKIGEESLKSSLRNVEQVIGFLVTKVTGIGSVGFGISELVNPEYFTVNTENPFAYIATGLALLAGKKVIERIHYISKYLKDGL